MSSTVGIDVGGTYTDLYFSGEDADRARYQCVDAKIIDRIDRRVARRRDQADRPRSILTGTTIATNAVIERAARAAP